ncbi:outer membrane beta-barrel protein [Robertkochia flava]|uniref:outer membrane beta-barrel protein n=1 Tax=Robertkochia flava TaxID=3447986 RepID=UPI001CCAEB38|nr:outer membrane beta-barrel protein [Robertkochia marina]
MKPYLSLSLLFLAFSVTYAQEIRLNTYGSYVFQDRFSSYFGGNSYFEGKIEDGFRWGAGIEYLIQGRTALEIQYLRQDTGAPISYRVGNFAGIEFTDYDLAINYIMLNSTRYFPLSERAEPFLGAGLGIGIFHVNNPDLRSSDSYTKFAWQIRGGSNLWLTDRLAFRVEAALASVVQAVGGGIYFGTGGSGISFDSYSTIYQFSVGGGIVFRFPGG